jgi:thiol-disulfide isomerase/thioredoxin
MPKLAAGFLVAVALIGCQSKTSTQPTLAPHFELKDLSGKTVSLASFRGRPVMLDFWATWCGPCQISIPLLQAFYQRHKEEGLVVLGVNMDEDPRDVYSFVKHFKMTYPVVYGASSTVPDTYQVSGLPTFIFIDAQGRITKRFEGFNPAMAEDWEREFRLLSAAR